MVERVAMDPYWEEQQITHLTDSQWGDTGKGKLVDIGGRSADVVVKTNGGANAGHTVNNEHGESKLHLMPSAIFHPDTLCIVGSNVVVDPIQLVKEYSDLKAQGISITPENLLLSQDATIVLEGHKIEDELRSKSSIGTTGRGIGPAYSDRTARTDLRLKHFLDPEFEVKLLKKLSDQERNARFLAGERLENDQGGSTPAEEMERDKRLLSISQRMDYETIRENMKQVREVLSPMITNIIEVIADRREQGQRILGEAGQGALLDLDFGTSPYVTSSHPGVVGFTLSTGIQPEFVGRVIGSTKAYMTRVGGGPMPTEQFNSIGDDLLRIGEEKGTTTGRDRRCGWFDMVATRYGIDYAAGITEIALTKLDVLDEFDTIQVCVAYDVDGRRITRLTNPDDMLHAKPIYETVKGWKTKTTGIRYYRDLPLEARNYISFIQEGLGKPVRMVSVGKSFEATIYRAA